MEIKVWVGDEYSGKVLEDLGTCVCDSPGRAVQMYESDADRWADKGYMATIYYRQITPSNKEAGGGSKKTL